MKKLNRNALKFLAAASALAAIAPQAYAQDATPAAPPAEDPAAQDSETGFRDIIVTARRREERIQDVPIAVSAVSGEDLAAKSVVQLSDLTRAVPALNIVPGGFGGGVPRFTIRSQTQFEQLLTLDPSVGVYFADVAQARAHGTNSGFFDIASVEVLKGPQGTLFGRNTTGGAIVITPNAPTDNLEGYLRATVGDYETRNFEGAVNVPLGDGAALRVSGRIADHKGYTYAPNAGRYFDDEHSTSWRASLRVNITDELTNILVANGYRAKEQGAGWRLTGVFPGSLIANARPDVFTFLNQAGNQRIAGTSNPDPQNDTHAWGLSNTTTLDLGEITLKNIFGYRKVDATSGLDFDGSPLLVWPSVETLHENQYSDEFQVLGKAFDNKLNWILGAYWFREKGDDTQRTKITLPPLFNQDVIRTGYVTNESKSLFAQGTYGLTDRLSLTAGARYTWDNRQFQQKGINLLTGNCSIVTAANVPIAQPCLSEKFSKDFGALTYTVSLDYKFGDGKLIYLAHRRGYHAGGYNLRANTPAQFLPFEPEVVKDIEAGLKADWDIGGTRLRTNLAAYYQDYTNIQRSITVPINGVLVTSVVNAATAKIHGFEAEIRWLPVRNVEIAGFVANSNFKYAKFEQVLAGGVVQDLSKNRLGFAPKWSGGGSIRVTQDLPGEAGSLTAQGDFYAQSQIELQDLNVPNGVAAPYAIANFRLEWNKMLDTGISTAFYVRNALDKRYFNSGVAVNGVGVITKTYAAPRTIGLELTIPFGK